MSTIEKEGMKIYERLGGSAKGKFAEDMEALAWWHWKPCWVLDVIWNEFGMSLEWVWSEFQSWSEFRLKLTPTVELEWVSVESHSNSETQSKLIPISCQAHSNCLNWSEFQTKLSPTQQGGMSFKRNSPPAEKLYSNLNVFRQKTREGFHCAHTCQEKLTCITEKRSLIERQVKFKKIRTWGDQGWFVLI